MKVLKVCFFIPFFPIVKGGAEYQSKLIATELQRIGHDVFFVSEGLKNGQVLFKDGFKIFGIEANPNLSEKITLYKSFGNFFEKIVKQEAPEIIYQRILNTFSFRISSMAKKFNIPYFLHIADNYSVEFSGVKGVFKQNLFKQIIKNKPIIICQTEYQFLKIKYLIKSTKVITVPNMHPVLMSTIKEKNKNEIIWVGNARPVKQLELFIELAANYKNSNYIFKVIGNLPKTEYGNNLQTLLKRHKNIKYYGEQENDFINNELSNAGLLVNTSVSEGFSNTFIQAWMCGTPVLSLNSDPDGVIKKYNLGINCNGNVSDLKKGLDDILSSDSYLDICNNALEKSNKLFSLSNNVKKIENLFKEISNH